MPQQQPRYKVKATTYPSLTQSTAEFSTAAEFCQELLAPVVEAYEDEKVRILADGR